MDTRRNGRTSTFQYPRVDDFEEQFRRPNTDDPDVKSILLSTVKDYFRNCSIKGVLLRRLPIINLFRTYRLKDYFIKDVISGVMSGVMMIPLGLAYASLSTLPHIVGLYMSFFASITYIIFGTSRHLTWGCVAIVSLMMADLMARYDQSQDAIDFVDSLNQSLTYHSSNTNSESARLTDFYDRGEFEAAINGSDKDRILDAISERRIEIASSVSIIAGFIFGLESVIGFDVFSALISNSLIAGFTVGIAFNVATSQMNGILGLSVIRYSGNFWIFRTWYALFGQIEETNVAVLVISLICLLVMYLIKKFINERYKHRIKIPIPVELLVVIVAIVVSKYEHLNESYDVRILGTVPMGIPKPKFPDILLVINYDYIVAALVIVFVAHVQSLAVAKTLSLEDARTIKPGQEMFAAGMCSVVCGLFSGYTPAAYVPISVAQRDSGGATQIASLFAAGIVLLVIMVMGPYFYTLPNCVMSAIILINLRPLFAQLSTLPEEWRKSKFDFFVWIFACLATIILEMGTALFISLGFNIALVLLRSIINPVLEVIPIQSDKNSSLQLRPVDQYIPSKTLLTVKFMKIKTSLYFFNSDSFIEAIFSKTNINRAYISNVIENKMHTQTCDSDNVIVQDETTPILSSNKQNVLTLVHWKTLIIDVSEVSFMDVMGVEALEFVINTFESIGISVMVTSVPDNLFGILRSTGFWAKHRDRLFIDVQSALGCMSTTQSGLESDTAVL